MASLEVNLKNHGVLSAISKAVLVVALGVLAILSAVFRGAYVDALGIGLAVVIVPALLFRFGIEPALEARGRS